MTSLFLDLTSNATRTASIQPLVIVSSDFRAIGNDFNTLSVISVLFQASPTTVIGLGLGLGLGLK